MLVTIISDAIKKKNEKQTKHKKKTESLRNLGDSTSNKHAKRERERERERGIP